MHPKETKQHGHKQHHHRAHHAKGGKVHSDGHGDNDPGEDVYAGEDSNVHKEAEVKTSGLGHSGRKAGGRVERKDGGRTKKAFGGSIEGGAGKRRLDRPGRKRGGRAGADHTPLTTASHITKQAEEHKADTGLSEDDTHSEGV